MYVILYPHKQQNSTKTFILWAGFLMLMGGVVVLLQELLLKQSDLNEERAIGAGVIVLLGILGITVGTDRLQMKEAYFSMNQERIRYRITVYGKEETVLWSEIQSMVITKHLVVFNLKYHEQVKLKLGAIQAAEVARHVANSLRLAAMEKHITINGVQMPQIQPYRM